MLNNLLPEYGNIDTSFYKMDYKIALWYYFPCCSVWLGCGNGGIWHRFRSCYEGSAFSTKESIVAWSMEMAFNRVCIILWCLWCIHQAKVIHVMGWLVVPIKMIWPCKILLFFHWFHIWIMFLMCDPDRYLSYVMDVATPTADCLNLVYDLLRPVLMKGHNKSMLSFQEVKIALSWNFNVLTS